MWKHGVKLNPESKREVRCFENTDRFRQLVLEDANQRLGFREKATSLTLDDIEAIYVACTFGQVSSLMQFYSVDLSKNLLKINYLKGISDFAWRVYQQPLIREDLFCSFQQLALDSDQGFLDPTRRPLRTLNLASHVSSRTVIIKGYLPICRASFFTNFLQ